ncbi:MAG TPA: zinc ribbon domain-containing protein [Candidatus Angelobacter sp.]|nr:zinc ribbon domain-containing protein [Candidatus Angelobacter sp.]
MQCAFCGTENRPEYKFCGMCGVRLERRQAERRARQSGPSIKCSSCGHMNETGLKFCGMCGTRVERRMQERRGAGDEARAAAIANAQLPTPEASGHAKTERASVGATSTATADLPAPGARHNGEPAIFQDESTSRGSTVRTTQMHRSPAGDFEIRDPRRVHSESTRSEISGPSFLGLNSQTEEGGEYLLEDEPSHGGLRKLILLVVLAAIIGLIFVQWRSNLKANPKPAPAKAEPAASPGPQSNNQPPAPANAGQPANQSKDPSAKDSGSTDAAAKDDAKVQADSEIPSVVPKANAEPTALVASNDDNKAAKSDDAKSSDDAKPSDDAKSIPDTKVIEVRPDHKPSAALIRAQQYLQGRGVPQNCEQGLLYLRAATEKNDPGAAIQMAALYSSGHCVKQDRVMAYRWFNSAHELEPANTWIQRNMDQLWAQMTPQERHLAGY